MNKTDLSSFNNSWYKPGAGKLKQMLWYFANLLFVKNRWVPVSDLKALVLKAFGAKIGKGVNIKPGVNIKYPWRLTIGNNVWLGEGVWIDNLGNVVIEDNVCISQGAFLLCGNHNYKKSTFDLIVGDITLKQGCWVGAKSVVCPGVTVGANAILVVGSVATKDLDVNVIYQGNPAIKVRERKFE